MKNHLIEKTNEITAVFSSKKRLAILIFLYDEPKNYSSLIKDFVGNGMKTSSSELYKNIHLLEKYGYIAKKSFSRVYMMTLKGMKTIEMVTKFTNIYPAVPKLVYDFGGEK